MGVVTVIISFAVCFAFNIVLNTFDVYSDTSLAFNTLTFNLGPSLLLSGCRVCHGKDEGDVFVHKNKSCQQCVTKNYVFQCGKSYELLDQMYDLERQDTCDEVHSSLYFDVRNYSYNVTNETCIPTRHDCCIENRRDSPISTILGHLDKRILAYHSSAYGHDRNELDYDIYFLTGKANAFYCHGMLNGFFDKSPQVFYSFFDSTEIRTLMFNKSEVPLKLVILDNGTLVFTQEFTHKDDCGMLIMNKQDKFVTNNAEETCDSDSCLVHLQALKYLSNISNLQDWNRNTFYHYGIKLGGETCNLLWQYGIVSLIPIIIHAIFNVLVFLEDIKGGKVYYVEFVFVMALFYPQWKTIRFLGEYLYHRNENVLNEAKDRFDSDVGSLEPFLEAGFQVS